MAEHDAVIIERQTIDGATVVKLDGEVDLIRSPQLRNELMSLLGSGVKRLVIDLSAVGFMDSSGVATLVEALQSQRRKQNTLILCGLQDKVKSIFRISRLDMVFDITDNVSASIE